MKNLQINTDRKPSSFLGPGKTPWESAEDICRFFRSFGNADKGYFLLFEHSQLPNGLVQFIRQDEHAPKFMQVIPVPKLTFCATIPSDQLCVPPPSSDKDNSKTIQFHTPCGYTAFLLSQKQVEDYISAQFP